MQRRALLVALLFVVYVAVIVAQKPRASESPVRVSIFTKDRKDDGGYLVRVHPTDSWEEFLGLGNARLKINSVCAVVDENNTPIVGLHGVYDGAEIFFVPCEGSVPSNNFEKQSSESGRPRVPQNLPRPLGSQQPSPFSLGQHDAPNKARPLFNQGARPPASSLFDKPPAGGNNVFGNVQQPASQQIPKFSPPTSSPSSNIPAAPSMPAAAPEAMIRFVPPSGDSPRAVGISWPADVMTGWGNFAMHLSFTMLQSGGKYSPVPLSPADESVMKYPTSPVLLSAFVNNSQQYEIVKKVAEERLRVNPNDAITTNFPIVHAVPPQFHRPPNPWFRGSKNVGVYMFEDTSDISDDSIRRAKRDYDAIILASQWNFKFLSQYRDHLPPLYLIQQGVDASLFRPREKKSMYPGHFVIFSGGKLEYRKGQDLVVDAFKQLLAKRPDMKPLLVVTWQNWWNQSMIGIEQTGHVHGLPSYKPNGHLDISSWLISNGLPAESFVDLGPVDQEQMAEAMANADVALFPNRGEGGTNLMAMQALATGVPTIISSNSGHLDLVHLPMLKDVKYNTQRHAGNYGIQHCYPLWKHLIISNKPHWGEPMIFEVVETLERVFDEPEAAKNKGQFAVEAMQHLTWTSQMLKVLEVVDKL